MNITFGMPEILVILSAAAYSQSIILSALFFLMGIFGRIITYGVEDKGNIDVEDK
jgi:hypothetical protein